MKKKYITPKSTFYEMEASLPLLTSVGLKHQLMWQYDGDQLHKDVEDGNGKIAGPGSEYVGTDNENNPVNESSIFDD